MVCGYYPMWSMSGWEDPDIGFEKVTAEVNKILGEVDEYETVPIDALLHEEQQEGGDDGGD